MIKLVSIMATLRSPNGCPWDRKQTRESLKSYLLEETYELLEAIDSGQNDDIKDELGDLLLQIVFLAELHREQGIFDLGSVAASINAKMIRRHPHVFADESPDNHVGNWEKIKQAERLSSGKTEKLADRISSNLPALKRASKAAKKANLPRPDEIIENTIDNLQTLKYCISNKDNSPLDYEHNLADLLYDMASLSTALQVDAEDILRKKTIEVIDSIDHQNGQD